MPLRPKPSPTGEIPAVRGGQAVTTYDDAVADVYTCVERCFRVVVDDYARKAGASTAEDIERWQALLSVLTHCLDGLRRL